MLDESIRVKPSMPNSHHFENSTYREHLVEHLFMTDLLQTAWLNGALVVEVLRCEADIHGYDLVLGRGDVVRHVQLKSSTDTAKAAYQKVNMALAQKPAGCVVWVRMKELPSLGRIDLSYSFFGGGPHEKLPITNKHKVAKHAKANAKGVKAERPMIRKVSKSEFRPVGGMMELLEVFFGDALALGPRR